MSDFGWVHLDVERVECETEKALQVTIEDGQTLWIPKSQIADAGDYHAGDEHCTVSVTKWYADKKGLDE